MEIEIEVTYRDADVTVIVIVDAGFEDIGIGHWECHGQGFDSRIIAIFEEEDISIIKYESYKEDKTYEFEFEKLNKLNKKRILSSVDEYFNNNNEEIVREVNEAIEEERVSYIMG